MKRSAEGARLVNVFKKLEKLEEHVEHRRDLVASLVHTEEVLRSSSSGFKEKKLALDAMLKDHGRPMNLPFSYGSEEHGRHEHDTLREEDRVASTVVLLKPSPSLAEGADQKFVDATNLCLLFKAFQPFLDRNTPHAAAMDILHSILHPPYEQQVYKHFAVEPAQTTMKLKTMQRRQRRRNLMLFQTVDKTSDGGVPNAKLKIAGHNGDITPLAFKNVLQYLTQGRADARSLRTLFCYFDLKDRVANEAVNLNNFLDGLDEIIQDKEYRAELVSLCFDSVCVPPAEQLSRGDIYKHIVPSGRLTPNQAHCLLDHFPPEEPLPRVPQLKRKKDKEKHKLLQLNLSHKLVTSYREGAKMTKKQFEIAFDESPYLLICFLDIVLRFAAHVISKEVTRSVKKPEALVGEGPAVAVYEALYYPKNSAKKERQKGKSFRRALK